jgi:hypothetical protein
VQRGRAGRERVGGRDGERQIPVFDLDQLGCVLRRRGGLRHHAGHALAHIAHAPLRERGTVRLLQRLAEAVGVSKGGGQRGVARRRHILAGQHRDNAGMGERGCLVDAGDLGVRPVGAHEHRAQLALEAPVRYIAPLPRQQARVLQPAFHRRHCEFQSSEAAANSSAAFSSLPASPCWNE